MITLLMTIAQPLEEAHHKEPTVRKNVWLRTTMHQEDLDPKASLENRLIDTRISDEETEKVKKKLRVRVHNG